MLSTLIKKDYYEILEINHDCPKKIFQKHTEIYLLNTTHQKPNFKKKKCMNFIFNKVLLDPNKKSIYNILDSKRLRKWIVDKDGNAKDAYKFLGNVYEIYDNFMDNLNIFELRRDNRKMIEDISTIFDSAFEGQKQELKKELPKFILI